MEKHLSLNIKKFKYSLLFAVLAVAVFAVICTHVSLAESFYWEYVIYFMFTLDIALSAWSYVEMTRMLIYTYYNV